MATSDNYNSSYPGQRREEAPLPPLPSSASGYSNHHDHQISPVISSSDDPSHGAGGQRSYQSLGANHEYYRPGGENPFEDPPTHYSDDIPLRQNPPIGNAASSSPYSPQYESNGIETMQDRDRRPDRVPKKKNRFLNKKIPWAVYFFTAVQIVVFLAELIKNGT